DDSLRVARSPTVDILIVHARCKPRWHSVDVRIENDARLPSRRRVEIESGIADGMPADRISEPCQLLMQELPDRPLLLGGRRNVDQPAGQRDRIEAHNRNSLLVGAGCTQREIDLRGRSAMPRPSNTRCRGDVYLAAGGRTGARPVADR